MAEYQLKKKSVNSKSLFEEIHGFIEEGIFDMDVDWSSDSQRESFVDLITDWLGEKAEEGLITHYKIICDKRNNTTTENEEGMFHLDISYKQYNCLNTTKLEYTVLDDEDFEDDDHIYDFNW